MRGRGQEGPERSGMGGPRDIGHILLLLAVMVGVLAGCARAGRPGDASGRGDTRVISMLIPRPIEHAPAPSALPQLDPLPAAPSTFAAGTPGSELILMDPATGAVYLQQNADTPHAMASTTKIMTALVALTYGKLDQPITVGADAILPAADNASAMGLSVGEVLTLRELLYGLLLPSGDDAAIAIAEGVAGSQARFVALMNDQAQALGLHATHYANVHGLDDPGQYSSAADLVRLAARALQNPDFAAIVSTPAIELPATSTHRHYTLVTTDELLFSPVYPGILGVKTGFTGNAGYCLVFAAAGPNGRLVGAVLGDPTYYSRFSDARALLDWGFSLEQRIRQLRHLAPGPVA
jgi:D-alanyl-D-alanine carboxypeptidase (penicillin-binding protein 5/6)